MTPAMPHIKAAFLHNPTCRPLARGRTRRVPRLLETGPRRRHARIARAGLTPLTSMSARGLYHDEKSHPKPTGSGVVQHVEGSPPGLAF